MRKSWWMMSALLTFVAAVSAASAVAQANTALSTSTPFGERLVSYRDAVMLVKEGAARLHSLQTWGYPQIDAVTCVYMAQK